MGAGHDQHRVEKTGAGSWIENIRQRREGREQGCGAPDRCGHTHSEEHRAGTLTASGPCATRAQDPSLLWQQVELEGLDEQVLAVRVVPHQALGVHVAQQKVPAQQGQTYTLHQLGCRDAVVRQQ